MNYIFSFEKLNVWIASKDLSIIVYQCTDKFPQSEKFSFADQIRRCAISISSNIAEGNARRSKMDRIRFFNIAFSSLMELISQCIIAFELGYMDDKIYQKVREKGIEISNKLIALINNQQTFL